MILLRLLYVEILKTKRSLALLMMMACPFFVVLIFFLMFLDRGQTASSWQMYWMGINNLWSYFMLPLYIGLLTALLNGVEHKNSAWRLMLSLPIHGWQIFVVKAIVGWGFALLSIMFLFIFANIGQSILQSLGINPAQAANFDTIRAFYIGAITCLPILLIQHIISWRVSNIVAPLAVSIIMTVISSQMMSSSYWLYNPWSYPIMAAAASNAQNQSLAISLSFIISPIILILGAVWLDRLEAPD